MAKNTATEEALGELHRKVATVMRKALETFEVAQERYLESDNEEVSEPVVSAPLLSVITKFLNDNKITCDPADSEDMTSIQETIRARRAKLKVVNASHSDDD